MQDHYCIAVGLRGEFEEGEFFIVVFEVTDGVGDDFDTGGAQLCKLYMIVNFESRWWEGIWTCPG